MSELSKALGLRRFVEKMGIGAPSERGARPGTRHQHADGDWYVKQQDGTWQHEKTGKADHGKGAEIEQHHELSKPEHRQAGDFIRPGKGEPDSRVRPAKKGEKGTPFHALSFADREEALDRARYYTADARSKRRKTMEAEHKVHSERERLEQRTAGKYVYHGPEHASAVESSQGKKPSKTDVHESGHAHWAYHDVADKAEGEKKAKALSEHLKSKGSKEFSDVGEARQHAQTQGGTAHVVRRGEDKHVVHVITSQDNYEHHFEPPKSEESKPEEPEIAEDIPEGVHPTVYHAELARDTLSSAEPYIPEEPEAAVDRVAEGADAVARAVKAHDKGEKKGFEEQLVQGDKLLRVAQKKPTSGNVGRAHVHFSNLADALVAAHGE